MSLIAPTVRIARRPHRVRLQAPTRVSDGKGGFTEDWLDLSPPALFVGIAPASGQDLERLSTGTVIATGSHVITGPWHPQVTTMCRLVLGTRIFQVVGIANREERNIDMVLLCVELETVPTPTPLDEAPDGE
jgi:head-tail adaptor